MLIIDMPMPNRCVECGPRLLCKRYIIALQEDRAEDLYPMVGDKDCLIKGELVRCGECKQYEKFDGYSKKFGMLFPKDNPCINGERKDGER